MKKQNLFDENIIKEAHDKLITLNKAFRKKSFAIAANSFARNRANEFLRSIGKRTFNTKGLTPGQKYLLGQAATAFIASKGSTPEGAIEISSKQQESFHQRLRDRAGFIPENFKKYEKVLEMYSPADLKTYFGYNDASNFIDTIIDLGNLNNSDWNAIVKFSKFKDKYAGDNIKKIENNEILVSMDTLTGEIINVKKKENKNEVLDNTNRKGYGY